MEEEVTRVHSSYEANPKSYTTIVSGKSLQSNIKISHTSNMAILQFSSQPPKKHQGPILSSKTPWWMGRISPPQVDPIGTNISPNPTALGINSKM